MSLAGRFILGRRVERFALFRVMARRVMGRQNLMSSPLVQVSFRVFRVIGKIKSSTITRAVAILTLR